VIARPGFGDEAHADGVEFALVTEGSLLGLARYDAVAHCLRPFLVLPREG
jgi:hypothetical protein